MTDFDVYGSELHKKRTSTEPDRCRILQFEHNNWAVGFVWAILRTNGNLKKTHSARCCQLSEPESLCETSADLDWIMTPQFLAFALWLLEKDFGAVDPGLARLREQRSSTVFSWSYTNLTRDEERQRFYGDNQPFLGCMMGLGNGEVAMTFYGEIQPCSGSASELQW